MVFPVAAGDSASVLNMVVSDIVVDETAESAFIARRTALKRGQRRALLEMLQRITLREHWASLPEIPDSNITDFVKALQIKDEKTSSVRYLGKLTVHFKQKKVRAFLEDNDFPYTETVAKPTLILPVLEKNGALFLFDKENVWAKAWKRKPITSGSLLPTTQPIGDLEDEARMTPDIALSGDMQLIEKFRGRYDAGRVAVLHAILTPDPASGGMLKMNVFRYLYGNRLNESVMSRHHQAQGETEFTFFVRVAEMEHRELEETWKNSTLVYAGDERALSVRLTLNGSQEWIAIRNRLKNISSLRKIEVKSLSLSGIQLEFSYVGDSQRLIVSFDQQDLALNEKDGFWSLRLKGVSRE